jgi:P4 family phage/plasmid primase-like protien
MNNLLKFLNEHKCKENEKPTHTSLIGGKYNIDDDYLENFFKLYSKALDERKETLHITEMRKKTTPIIFDIDFKHKGNKRIYNNKHILNVIKIINKNILKYTDLSEKEIEAFVFEKEKPVFKNDDIFADGIHIMYPYICMDSKVVHLIRLNVIKKIKNKKYFKDLETENNLEDIFDKSVIDKTNWCLYGSHKKGGLPYLLTKIYNYNLEEKEKDFKTYDLVKILSVRKFYETQILKIKDIKNVLKKLEKNNLIKKKINNEEKNIEKIKNNFVLNDIIFLSESLNIERATNYNDWINVGLCLHNIDKINNFNDKLLNCWINFSKKSNKYKEGECDKLWKKFKYNPTGFKFGTLVHWVKSDNSDAYKKYTQTRNNRILNDKLTINEYDIAQILHKLYGDLYKCTSIKHQQWVEYRNNKWIEIDKGYTLRNLIANDLENKFLDAIGKMLKKKCGDSFKDDDNFNDFKNYEKYKKRFKDTAFKDNVMKEAAYIFYDFEFYKNLDENRDILCCDNGIYDLKNDHFREGVPDDYVSLSTKTDYIKYDKTIPEIIEIKDFIKKILPNRNVRRYVLKLFSSMLSGHTIDERFNIFSGCGSNGKSKLIELFLLAIGDYGMTLPITLLTQKRGNSSQATPELAATKGKRFCILQEPENNDKINVGMMKEYTGGDKIMARALFKEPIEFKPQFKLILTCNKLPHIPSNDKGTWRRIKLVEFLSLFVDDPDPNKINEFKKDKHLVKNFERWGSYFLSLLIHYYKKYKNEGLIEPEEIIAPTKKYCKRSDPFADFCDEQLIFTDDKKDKIKLDDIFKHFVEWYKEGNGSDGKCKIKKCDFEDYLYDNYDRNINRKIMSKVQIKLDDEIDEYDDEIDDINK